VTWPWRDDDDTILRKILKHQETMMAQLDDLQAALTEIGTKVDGVATEVADLIAKLKALPPSVDLTAAIAQAQGILTKLQAIPPEPA
jgi:peptidoglycan hydrolase CwlO-like protein